MRLRMRIKISSTLHTKGRRLVQRFSSCSERVRPPWACGKIFSFFFIYFQKYFLVNIDYFLYLK